MYIRIALGIFFLIVLIVGLARKRKQKFEILEAALRGGSLFVIDDSVDIDVNVDVEDVVVAISRCCIAANAFFFAAFA